MAMERAQDPGGRAAGMVMVVVGVLLLLLVFALALLTFAALPEQLRAAGATTLEGAGRVLALAAARALLLFVMAYAASLLASKGLELYHFSTERPAP